MNIHLSISTVRPTWIVHIIMTRKWNILFSFSIMTTKPGEQPVDEQTRDKVFAEIKNINQNNICIDCQKKNPKWTSVHLGIHLCLDCAGKHRQYGVIYSFVKSTNLDAWNQKQIIYMQKGGNTRALQFFRKRGVITANNRHIDYKSGIVQQYKAILTDEVQLELSGGAKAKQVEPQKKAVGDFFNNLQNEAKAEQKKVEIPKAETVEEVKDQPKKKKEKKKIGAKQIDMIDFQKLNFDDGVPVEQKEKIVKQYQKKKDQFEDQPKQSNSASTHSHANENAPAQVKIEQPKQLTVAEASKKIQQLKLQTNLKAISSQQFKDTAIDNVVLKQNLNKFSGSTSISSSAFFNKQEDKTSQTLDNIKGAISDVGGKLFNKLSGYWKK